MSSELTITREKLWPSELLYWRRMSSKDISNYIAKTPLEKRLILIVWGTIESHGPFMPVANDSHLAVLAADKVAYRLLREHKVQPIIVDIWKDVGSPSATWEFPGAVGYSSHPVPVIQEIWEQTLLRLVREGFRKFFLVNGDGGNWLNHWPRLKWDSAVIRRLQKEGVILEGSNWDQEGGEPYPHAGVFDHALIKWACDFAPEFERLSALRHGLKPADEAGLPAIDGATMGYLENEKDRLTDWSQYPGQDKLRSVTEFSLKRYQEVLYNPDGTPRTKGGVREDFEAKIDMLMRKVLKVVKKRSVPGKRSL